MGKGFRKEYLVTLGADFAINRVGNNVIQIWDLAGQYNYKSIRKNYYQGAIGAILVFDKTKIETFNHLGSWVDELLYANSNKIPIVVVGNKSDLCETKHCIDKSLIEKYIKELSLMYGYKFHYIDSSAESGLNIEKMFNYLIEETTNQFLE